MIYCIPVIHALEALERRKPARMLGTSRKLRGRTIADVKKRNKAPTIVLNTLMVAELNSTIVRRSL